MFIKVCMSILVFLMFVDNASAGILFQRCCRRNNCTYQRVFCNPNRTCSVNTQQEEGTTCSYIDINSNSNSKLASSSKDNNKTTGISTLPDPSELYPEDYYALVGEENTDKSAQKNRIASNNESLDSVASIDNVDVDFVEGADALDNPSNIILTKAKKANKKEEIKKEESKDDSQLTEDELAFVEEINKLRTARGLSEVVVSKKLMEAARKQSNAMSKSNKLYHNIAGIPSYAMQNIAKSSSISNVISTWKSYNNGNLANIMNPKHKYIGVANTDGFFTLILSGNDINK